MPGIIQSFDPDEQTVSVQLAIRERIRDGEGRMEFVNLPLLLDVPILMPRAGGYIVTMPVSKGDECLVVFGDMCIDAWWSNGEVQNQIEKRRHDLSDGFAILGPWSQPNKIQNYSTDSVQLRTEDGNTYIEIKQNEINIVASVLKINGNDFVQHTHSDPQGGFTGPVII